MDFIDLDRPPSFLGYAQISQWIDSLAGALRAERFVAVAAVLRGGLFPAQCAAFVAGVPLAFIRYDRGLQVASWQGDAPPRGPLLLCDDIAGHGHTLVNCRALVQRTHPEHRLLTIVSDEYSRIRPDWSMRRPQVQTVLPWERETVSLLFKQDYWLRDGAHGREPMKPDPCYRRWGVDLDGVLCARQAPSLNGKHHVIVTGRPLTDRERTRAWLDGCGYAGIEVHHRDPAVHGHDDASVARHKAAAAERLGLTDFLESCPRQALLISARVPQLRVFWWDDGKPVLVSAHPTLP